MRTMNILSVAAVALTMVATPVMANCRSANIITPNDAPVSRIGAVIGGGGSTNDLNPGGTRLGNCATIAQDDPLNRPNGYCEWARNLSSLAKSVTYTSKAKYTTYDGNVPDVIRHQHWEWLGWNNGGWGWANPVPGTCH